MLIYLLIVIAGLLWIIAGSLDPEKQARRQALIEKRRNAVPLFSRMGKSVAAGFAEGFAAMAAARRAKQPLVRVLDLDPPTTYGPAPNAGRTIGVILFVIGVTTILLLAMTSASGQQLRHYDDGNSVGTTTIVSPNSTRSYDQRGRSLGTSTTDSQGTTTYYDSHGRVIGKTALPPR